MSGYQAYRRQQAAPARQAEAVRQLERAQDLVTAQIDRCHNFLPRKLCDACGEYGVGEEVRVYQAAMCLGRPPEGMTATRVYPAGSQLCRMHLPFPA